MGELAMSLQGGLALGVCPQMACEALMGKSGELKSDSEPMSVALAKWTDPVIPVGWKLAIDKLIPGSYRVEVNAIDSNGSVALVRTAEFEIE